jgi:hypothetical protein
MRRTLIGFAAVLLLAACQSDSTAPVETTVYGRYVLRTLDGDAVPAVFTDATNFKLEIMKGVVTLNQDHTFTDSTDVRRTEGTLVRRVVDVAAGTFEHNGAVITLSSTRGERYTMTFSDRTLTQNLGGSILVYRR